jgi:hypothetical protein
MHSIAARSFFALFVPSRNQEMKKHQATLRLVVNRDWSAGYRSGRNRDRDTPLTASISNTRSAGALPAESQPEIVPCDLSDKRLANADWPPTFEHASSNASFDSGADDSSLMGPINAQSVNNVNAYSVKSLRDTAAMSKRAETPPSPFWQRLTDAWQSAHLPVTQNGVAVKLGMSQGSVRRWYTGDGLPEFETAVDIAKRGKVCVEWLLTGRGAKTPIVDDYDSSKLLEAWNQLDGDSRAHVLRTAVNELNASKPTKESENTRGHTIQERRPTNYGSQRRSTR